MQKTTKTLIITVLLLCTVCTARADVVGTTFKKDTITTLEVVKEKKTFLQRITAPFRWIGKNWSAYDPRYSTPSFYNWAAQIQNTFSNEALFIRSSEVEMNMESRLSSKIGPYFGYNWVFYGYTVDLAAWHGTKRRNEYTLSINSALVNAEIIWRKTGGDYRFTALKVPDYSKYYKNLALNGYSDDNSEDELPYFDIKDEANSKDYGDYVTNNLRGFNLSFFTNHKKYSNPAAFSNGAIQLRSVGSPILGFGFTYQHIVNQLSDIGFDKGLSLMASDPKEMDELNKYRIQRDRAGYRQAAEAFLRQQKMKLSDENTSLLVTNVIPSSIAIKDLHFQIGYAYNLVFSRRLLFGLSLIASPGVKWLRSNNENTMVYQLRSTLSDICNELFGGKATFTPEYMHISDRNTILNINGFARASLTYNLNRWRMGVNANVSFYHNSRDSETDDTSLSVTNIYGSACVYVGYCFGRKKEYRWDGEKRQAYIQAALTKHQMEEIRDTMPTGNINIGHEALKKYGKTKYQTDVFNLNINGCDLVKGPDGTYGQFEIQDGRIAEGNDTEGRLKAGTILPMDKDGDIEIKVGSRLGIRPTNWMKSQLTIRQMPSNWYPEMLHYSLRGKLTMYVRNHQFGTSKPVKLEIENFFLSHGKETKEFYLLGANTFKSHSAYSIVGKVLVNGRVCRVYIEPKHRGTRNNVYINPKRKSGYVWMKGIPGDRPISQIAMPGTHDSGSASLMESMVNSMGHTQNFIISEQLHDGIRAFDIRLKENMKYGHTMPCREGFDDSMVHIAKFLKENPSEFIVILFGSDENGKWTEEMKKNLRNIIAKYPGFFVEDFKPSTPISEVRGKILVLKRQEECPIGKLLKFQDNAIFEYDGFHVEDIYREHKTYKKAKIVEEHLREAYENEDPDKWYITFNSIAWDPRHHKPYYSAWGGAINIRRPMNKALRETIEQKGYCDFGIVFLDFYNDHGDKPELVKDIILSNYHLDREDDYIFKGEDEDDN